MVPALGAGFNRVKPFKTGAPSEFGQTMTELELSRLHQNSTSLNAFPVYRRCIEGILVIGIIYVFKIFSPTACEFVQWN